MLIETFSVGPLGCNCSILTDPEAGEAIVIDPKTRTLDLDLPTAEIAARMAGWRAPDASQVRPGSVHHKYVRLVSSAHFGCVV